MLLLYYQSKLSLQGWLYAGGVYVYIKSSVAKEWSHRRPIGSATQAHFFLFYQIHELF